MFFSLRWKLVVFTLFFIITSMLTVGIMGNYYLRILSEKNAKVQLKESFRDISVTMKNMENNIFNSLYNISTDDTVINSINMISNGGKSDKATTRKEILKILKKENRYVQNDLLALYDVDYNLVAYIYKEGKEFVMGYLGCCGDETHYYSYNHYLDSYEKVKYLPPIELQLKPSARIGGVEVQSGEVEYEIQNEKLFLKSNRAIIKELPNGKNKILGYVLASNTVTQEDLNNMLDNKNLQIEYFSSTALQDLGETSVEKHLIADTPLLFSKYDAGELILLSTSDKFISGTRVPMNNGIFLIKVGIDNYELLETLHKSQRLMFIMLLTVVLLSALVGIQFLERMVSKPLKRLIEGLNGISDGDYQYKMSSHSSDEFKVICNQFNQMAKQINIREEKLQKLSQRDHLTGLYNRRHFDEIIEFEWRRSIREKEELSIIMVDIDLFKAYNDTYGHQKGDECLIAVAQTLQSCMQRSGDMVTRYGGEEFIITLPNTPLSGAKSVAKCFQQKLEEKMIEHKASTVSPVVTISIGIATDIPTVDSEISSLIKLADNRLYKAKETGRNRIIST